MAKYLLLCSWLVILKTSSRCGLPIFLKVNHRLESRMQEICQSGSEGGAKRTFVPTPIFCNHPVCCCGIFRTNEFPNFIEIIASLRVEVVAGHEPDCERSASLLF